MSTPTHRPPALSTYTIVPLETLDGVLVQVLIDGETAGFCFGSDERAAVDAAVGHLTQPGSRSTEGPHL